MKTIWFATFALGLVLILEPGRALAQRPLGIDVSAHEQPGIDWVGVKNSGVSFAWAKATEGVGYQDANFLIYATNAQAAGVLLGAYHYARYDLNLGLTGATNEANWFWSVAGPFIKGNGGYLVPFLDVEQDTTNYTMTTLSQWVVAWCNVVSNNAYASGVVIRPMIYTYPSYASTYLNSTLTPFTLNMATVTPPQDPQTGAPSCSGPWGCNWTVWQYAWNNTVANIYPCDVDTFNGTYSGMIGTLSPRNKHSIVDGYCGNDGNGIMQVFLPDAVNKLESVSQSCPNCSWGGWSSSGGPVCFGSPAVVGYNADLRMQIFVRGADNNLWTIWKTSPNGAWGAWSDLGGSCFADPTVGANGDGRMQLFIQTSAHTVQSNFKTGAGAWFGWVDYGGSCYGKPAVANLENSVMQVFTRTAANTVQTISQTSPNGTWGTWSSLGGDCVDDPVAGYNSDGRIELFTRTSLHTVSANYKTTPSPGAAWSGWNGLGGNCYSGLTVGYNADSRMQLFMRDATYNVQSIWQTSPGGTWSSYLNMAGNTPAVLITTQPASQSVTQGQTATFTVAANNALAYQWRFNAANISSATTTSYTVTNAQPANAGGYSVVVTNAGGTAVSATASLAVVVPAFAMKNFQVQTNGTFHFEFSGTANQTYSLWTSTNLVQWQQIGFSTQDTPGQYEANDPAATNYSSRFYELRWP